MSTNLSRFFNSTFCFPAVHMGTRVWISVGFRHKRKHSIEHPWIHRCCGLSIQVDGFLVSYNKVRLTPSLLAAHAFEYSTNMLPQQAHTRKGRGQQCWCKLQAGLLFQKLAYLKFEVQLRWQTASDIGVSALQTKASSVPSPCEQNGTTCLSQKPGNQLTVVLSNCT